jgi:hypothetical protein
MLQAVQKVDLQAAQLAVKEVEIARASRTSKTSNPTSVGYGNPTSGDTAAGSLLDVKA